jgi:hypothetical protein
MSLLLAILILCLVTAVSNVFVGLLALGVLVVAANLFTIGGSDA